MHNSENEEIDITCTPPDIRECAEATCQSLMPAKSREKYELAFKKLMEWCTEHKINILSENVIIAYMTNLSKKIKPSTLWTTYSMLKSTLLIRKNVDISRYNKLKSFLKLQSTGYKTKKSKILSTSQIKKFIEEAPDNKYLFTKVVLIFGISGGCRRQELKNLQINHVRDLNNELLVKLIVTKTKTNRTFIIPGMFYEICKKYMSTRPPNMEHFFLNYQNGKCVKQVAGINKIGEQPKIITRYLRLPDADSFTGHCFRRSGATILADSGGDTLTVKNYGGWKSTSVMETYVEQSLQKKEKIGNAILHSIGPNSASTSTPNINYNNINDLKDTSCSSIHYDSLQYSNSNSNQTDVELPTASVFTEILTNNNVQNNLDLEQSKEINTNVYNNCSFNNCTFIIKK